MKLTIRQDLFDDGLRLVGRAVSSKNTVPVLSGICLEASHGRLRLRATDLERAVATAVEADVATPGAVVLPGRTLLELARRLPPGPVTLSVDDQKGIARIAGAEVELALHGIPADQFPQDPAAEAGEGLEVAAEPLRRLLRETGFVTGHDESRPWFTGVYLAVQGERLVAMATDAAVVAYSEAAVANPADLAFSVILPGPTVQELGRLLGAGGAAACAIRPVHNQMRFDLGSVSLTSRLLEGQYPDFRRVMPSDFPSRVRLSRLRLLEGCERAALLAKDGEIRLDGQAGALQLSARFPEVGRVAERIGAVLTGEPFEIGLNVRFLLDGLRAMDGEEVLVEYAGRRSPVRFRSGPERPAFFAVMPLIQF